MVAVHGHCSSLRRIGQKYRVYCKVDIDEIVKYCMVYLLLSISQTAELDIHSCYAAMHYDFVLPAVNTGRQ